MTLGEEGQARRVTALSRSQAADIDRLFETWSAEGPGGVVALQRQGEVVYRRRYGLANLEHAVPVADNARFPICSITKTFTGAACALLHHKKRLDLDAEVRDYLPELRLTAPMRVRHLLNMTSGLRDSVESMMVRGGWYRRLRSEQDLIDLAFAQTTQSFPTGQRYAYTNINFNLATLIIERVSGLSYADYLARTFWQPLGMNDTLMRDTSELPVARLADAYVAAPEGWLKGLWSFGLSGAGSLVSTVDDLLRWQGFFRAGGIDGAPIVPMMAEAGVLSDGSPIQYGLGLGVRPYRGVTILAHGGGVPGYRAMFARVPERDLGLVILANRHDKDLYVCMREIVDICLDGELPLGKPARAAADLSALDGRYLDRQSGEPIAVRFDAVSGSLKLEKLGTVLSLHPAADGTLVDGWANFRSTLHIEPTPAGRPTLRLDFGGQRGIYEPIDPYDASAEDLAAAVGIYRCADLRSEAEISLRNGAPVIRFGQAFHAEAELPLAPLAKDMFLAGYERPWTKHPYAVRFQRSGSGTISRLLVSSDLLKDTLFVRS